jgi:hypothetical protein
MAVSFLARRRNLIMALATTVILLAWVCYHRFVGSPPGPVTRVTFEYLTNGMTRADVEAILGPAGDYSSGPLVAKEPSDLHKSFKQDIHKVVAAQAEYRADGVAWVGDQGLIIVYFNADGRVTRRTFFEVDRRYDSLLARIWRWFAR